MDNLLILILALAEVAGQLIRIPFAGGALTLLDIVSVLLILFGLFKIKFKFFNPPLFLKIGFLFILICLISLVITPIKLTANEFITGFAYIARFGIYLFLGIIFFTKPFENLRGKAIQTLLYSGIILSIIGLLQFIILPDLQFFSSGGWDPHFYRTVSTFLDPNFAGAYFSLTFLLLMSLRTRRLWQSILFLSLVYIALLTTFSRSSYLMFLASSLIFSFLKKSKILFLSSLVLFLGLLLGFQIYVQLVANPKNIDREQSASFRFNTWEQGSELFQKFPILGVGFNAYRYAIREYNLGDELFLKSHGSSSNDSSLLFVASTTGLVGLFVYLYFLFSMIKFSFPKNPILISALGGLLIHSIFANSLFYPSILIWIILVSTNPQK